MQQSNQLKGRVKCFSRRFDWLRQTSVKCGCVWVDFGEANNTSTEVALGKILFLFSYRDILSMMWLIRVSEKPGISLWMISFTNMSVTPGQLRSANSNDARRSIMSVEFRFPLLLLWWLLYWCRLLVIYKSNAKRYHHDV